MNFKFCTHILVNMLDYNKSPLRIWGKSSCGRSQRLPKIFRESYIVGASRGHLCDSTAFLLFFSTASWFSPTPSSVGSRGKKVKLYLALVKHSRETLQSVSWNSWQRTPIGRANDNLMHILQRNTFALLTSDDSCCCHPVSALHSSTACITRVMYAVVNLPTMEA